MLKTKFWSFSGEEDSEKRTRGIIDAPNKAIARHKLLKMGFKKIYYFTISFNSYKKIFHLNDKEKLNIFHNISIQINAGISIIDTLESIRQDAISFKINYLFFNILKSLHEGHYFSSSIEKLPYCPLTKTELSLIKSAEISGNLDNAFTFIGEKLKNQLLIKQKIISSLIYPTITLILSLIVVFIVFKFIIPQFEIIFSQHNNTLPAITQFIFSISKHSFSIFSSFFLLLSIIFLLVKSTIKNDFISKKLIENCLIKIPIMGKIILLKEKINFCFTLSMLLKSGIPLHDALKTSIQQVKLPYSQDRLKQAAKEIILGKPLSSALKKSFFLPHTAIQTLVAAENTGRLDSAFGTLEERLTSELSVFSDQLGSVIEPFIIIILGVIIGVIVIAIYLPIFQLGNLY